MYRKIFYSLIAVFLLMSALSETRVDTQFRGQQVDKTHTSSEIAPDNCGSCENNGCHQKSGHCRHHCHGLHYLGPLAQEDALLVPQRKQGKTLLSPDQNYIAPFLDPSLKPPLALS